MKLSFNLDCFEKHYENDYASMARIAKQVGFDLGDVCLCSMVRDDDQFNQSNYRALAEDYRRQIEGEGLFVNQTHAPFRFTEWNDNAFEEVVFPRTVRSLEISALLGAKVAVVHPLHHFVYRGHEEEVFEANMRFYRRLIPYCREYGIMCGIENMYQIDSKRKQTVHDTCSHKEEFVRYIDTLDSEYMVACLDIGHVCLPSQADEPHDFIRALGHDRLKALHVNDNDYRGDRHDFPYLGKINWDEVTRALAEIDYTGDFTYEVQERTFYTMDKEILPFAAEFAAKIGRHLISKIDGYKNTNNN